MHGDSVIHHRAVQVSQNIDFERPDLRIRQRPQPGLHVLAYGKNLRIALLCVWVEEVDEGKTVNGAMLEVYRHAKKVELTERAQANVEDPNVAVKNALRNVEYFRGAR